MCCRKLNYKFPNSRTILMKKITILILIVSFSLVTLGQNLENISELNTRINLEETVNLLNNESVPFKKKSAGLAILYSILLPGMGELYADNFSAGKYFTIADGVIWGVFAGITIYGNNKEDDYRAFAKSYGGVTLEGKDDTYFANIGTYQNIDRYNTEMELNRNFDEVYNENTHYWSWQTNDLRKDYRSLWTSSENAKNNVRFAVGALILNRIVSAIFAVRAVSAYNKRETQELSWNVNFNYENKINLPSRLVMNFNYGF